MATVYACPACQKQVRVNHPSPEGHRFRCSHCGTIFRALKDGQAVVVEAAAPPPAAAGVKSAAAPSAIPPASAAVAPAKGPPAGKSPPLIDDYTKPPPETVPLPTDQSSQPKSDGSGVRPLPPDHPGTKPKPPARTKDTYAGRERLADLEAPGKDTYPGSERLADLDTSARKARTKETCAGTEKIADLEPPPAAREPRPGKPTFPGTAKPFEEGEVPAGTRLVCSSCQTGMKLRAATAVGRKVKCPKCGQLISVEMPAAAAPPAAPAPPAEDDWAGAEFLKLAPLQLTRPAEEKAEEKPAEAKPESPPAPAGTRRPLPLKAIIGAAVVLLALVVFLLVVSPLNNPDVPDSAWVAFNPPDGHCQIDMPGQAVPQTATASQGPSRRFQVQRKERDSLFTITYVELPGEASFRAADFEELCWREREELARGVFGSIRSDRTLEWKGHEAREFVAVNPTGRLAALRIVWVQAPDCHRLYFLGAQGSWTDASQGAPARFFASLKLPPRNLQAMGRP